MYLLNVLVERRVLELNKPFLYAYQKDKKIDKGFRVLVDFNGSHVVGFVLEVAKTDKTLEEINKDSNFIIKEIIEVIDEEKIINEELFSMAEYMEKRYVSSLISCLQTILPPTLKPSSSYKTAPKIAYEKYVKYECDAKDLTPKQNKTLDIIKQHKLSLKNLYDSGVIKNLIAKKCISIVNIEKYRYKSISNISKRRFELTNEQKNIYDEFIKSDDKVYLLKGITGSGKTEVYIKIIEYYLKQGKNALVLVPEINLTPLLKLRFIEYFDEEIGILHSGLTPAEKYDEYRKILKGNVRIVIGTRSAIFSPLTNIGIIVLDEEFSDSYKNQNSPFYDAIDLAIYRASIQGSKVLLASATPSLNSMARANKGVYHLLELENRYNKTDLPITKIVNMNDINSLLPGFSGISMDLFLALQTVLNNKKQAILLLNNRGYSRRVVCAQCNETQMCPRCGMPLHYHKINDKVVCHNCGFSEAFKDYKCQDCNSRNFIFRGSGTEKFVEQLKQLFPKTNILRFDSDIASNERKISKILNDFQNGNIDILVGTEMVAKGHDFPNVNLVGIVSADDFLEHPSYKAAERVFQIITQCVGRSGRGDEPGYAIVQANSLNNYAIKLACLQDYDLFYKKEMEIRKKLSNPPYFYLSKLIIESKKEERIEVFTQLFLKTIRNIVNDNEIICYATKINLSSDTFRSNIIIKYKNPSLIIDFLNKYLNNGSIDHSISITVDVDSNG